MARPAAIDSASAQPVEVPLVCAALHDPAAGRMPDLAGLSPALVDAIRAGHGACASRDSHDLVRTVAFSIRANAAMAAVARITGEVRDTDGRAHAMSSAVEELTASVNRISAAADQVATEMESADAQSERGAAATTEAANASRGVVEAFGRLLAPHEAVHRHGKKAAELVAAGHREAAAESIAAMDKASAEVLALLDQLIAR